MPIDLMYEDSNVQIDRPAYEYVYSVPQYVLRDYRCLGVNHSHLYLLQDMVTGKFNVYCLDFYIKNWYKFEEILVNSFQPLPLDIAWFMFPHFSLTEESYGF